MAEETNPRYQHKPSWQSFGRRKSGKAKEKVSGKRRRGTAERGLCRYTTVSRMFT